MTWHCIPCGREYSGPVVSHAIYHERRELTLAEYRAINAATFYMPAQPLTVRTVTLYATLTGETWWPSGEGQLSITVDLIAESARDVSRSGMVAAIRAAVDGAGDFRSARLTADSFVMIEHRRLGPPDGTVRSWSRRVDVADLPSLSDYVASDTYSYSEVD